MQHAPEYWILAQAILQGIQNPDLTDNNDTSLSAGSFLSRFDETDMSQVNRLIKQFENLNILNTWYCPASNLSSKKGYPSRD